MKLHIFLFSFLMTGCSSGGMLSFDWNSASSLTGSNSNLGADLQAQALGILQVNCASCHTNTSGPNNIYGFNDVNHMISTGLLIPGDPSASSIYTEVANRQMPPGGSLSSSDQDTLYAWIAGNNSSSSSTTTTSTTTTMPSSPVTTVPSPTTTVPSGPALGTFKYLQKYVLNNCTGCHTQSHATSGYAFDTYNNTLKAVNTQSPTQSLLYTITKSGQMPPSSSLSASQESVILTWIQGGALNN